MSLPQLPLEIGGRHDYCLNGGGSVFMIKGVCGVSRGHVLLSCSDGAVLIVPDEWYDGVIGWRHGVWKAILEAVHCVGEE